MQRGRAHPALLAARKQLLAAITARRELTADPLARAAYHLEEAMLIESDEVEPNPRAALAAYREALSLGPDSVLAARGLERLGTHLGDHAGVITSQMALSKLAETPSPKPSTWCARRCSRTTTCATTAGARAYEVPRVGSENATPPRRRGMLGPNRAPSSNAATRARTRRDQPQRRVGTEVAQSYLRIYHGEGEAARIDYAPACKR